MIFQVQMFKLRPSSVVETEEQVQGVLELV